MKKTKIMSAIGVITLALALSACSNTQKGALIGAGAGAAVGGLASGSATGALIGAGVGAAGGALVGHASQRK